MLFVHLGFCLFFFSGDLLTLLHGTANQLNGSASNNGIHVVLFGELLTNRWLINYWVIIVLTIYVTYHLLREPGNFIELNQPPSLEQWTAPRASFVSIPARTSCRFRRWIVHPLPPFWPADPRFAEPGLQTVWIVCTPLVRVVNKSWVCSWWFQIFLIFTPIWGNDPHFDRYFSNWVETTNQTNHGFIFQISLVHYRGYGNDNFAKNTSLAQVSFIVQSVIIGVVLLWIHLHPGNLNWFALENRPGPKRKIQVVFQPIILSGAMLNFGGVLGLFVIYMVLLTCR